MHSVTDRPAGQLAEAFVAQILPDHFAVIEFDDVAKPEVHPDSEQELEVAGATA